MITRVRLRPASGLLKVHDVERLRKYWPKLEGRYIEIDTNSMTSEGPECEGRAWRVTDRSINEVRQIIDAGNIGDYVCEHQIEID